MNNLEEGWVWLSNTKKVHYFRQGRSLCSRWGCLGPGPFSLSSNDLPLCSICAKRREKEQEKELVK